MIFRVLFLSFLALGASKELEEENPESEASLTPPQTLPSLPTYTTLIQEVFKGTLSYVDDFSPEKNPGRGVFSLENGADTKLFKVGSGEAYRMHALFLPASAQDEKTKKQWQGFDVYQLVLELQNKNPSTRLLNGVFFAAAPLPSGGVKSGGIQLGRNVGATTHQNFTFSRLNEKDKKLIQRGLMSMQIEEYRSPEEKLKNLFFAESGNAKFSFLAGLREVQKKAGERNLLLFNLQPLRIEMEASLATPFNPEKRKLKGTFEMALFSPKNLPAFNYLRETSAKSVENFALGHPN